MGKYASGKHALAISDRSGLWHFLILKWLENGMDH
jgi:hypothetical protein